MVISTIVALLANNGSKASRSPTSFDVMSKTLMFIGFGMLEVR